MSKPFGGVTTALVTPFKRGQVDVDSFRRLLRDQLRAGVDGVVVNGTTGESPTLDFGEVKQLFAVAREELGSRVKVLVGTGSNCTKTTIEKTRAVSAWNPDAVLVVVPYYNRPPQRGLLAHFSAVAESSKVPVILYDVPTRTASRLEAETVAEIARRSPNVVGLKDASGDLEALQKLRAVLPAEFTLLSGDDATAVEFVARGGDGVIAVASHIIGAEMKAFIKKAANGDASAAVEYRKTFTELFRCLYREANPIPVKAALNIMSLLDSDELRLPLVALAKDYRKEMEACLKALAKIVR